MARKIVVIENGLLASMAANPQYTNEFPFLGGLSRTPGGKGGCRCGRKDAARDTAFSSAKSALVGMSMEKKVRLKKLLDTEKVRVTVMEGNQRKAYTF